MAIVTALKKGEVRRAVELILDSYNDDLFSYCARLAGLRSGVPVYQATLSAAIDSLGDFDGQTSLRAWLYGIAREGVLKHHRSFPTIYPEAQDPTYCPVGAGEEETLAPGSEELLAAMGQLEPRTQEILQLCFWQGLHLVEVAHVLGAPVERVRSLASEALGDLGMLLRQSTMAPC